MMPPPPRRPLLVWAVVLLAATPLAAEDPAPVPEAVRKTTIKKLGRDLRKKATSARAAKYRDEILKILDSLEVLGGHEAGAAALEAVAFADAEVRDRVFAFVETEHHAALVKPLVARLEDKRFRHDVDLRRRVARSLAIMGDASAMPPLTDLIRTDEEPTVVAQAADSLATFSAAPLRLRKEAVKRLVDAYTATWNLMMSIREEDKIIAAKMRKQYKVYGRSLRAALQALTGEQTISRPQAWREWWNEHKKRTDW